MSDCFVLYLLLTCMKKKTSGADKFTNNTKIIIITINPINPMCYYSLSFYHINILL